MNVLEWLRQRPDGLQYIDDEMQKLIVDFSLLWMYFEANYLGMDGTPEVLLHMVEKLAKAGLLDGTAIEPPFAYFRQRYLVDGKPSPHFADLKLANKWKEVVENGLRGSESVQQQLDVCVLILNRYRNNLFHGPKWIARFEGDRVNLVHAVGLVTAIIRMSDGKKIQ